MLVESHYIPVYHHICWLSHHIRWLNPITSPYLLVKSRYVPVYHHLCQLVRLNSGEILTQISLYNPITLMIIYGGFLKWVVPPVIIHFNR